MSPSEQQVTQVNQVLKKWRGAHAQLWSYTASLASLEIRLYYDDASTSLSLICSPCVSIAAPVNWERSELVVADDSTDDDLFALRDGGADVLIRCRHLWTSEKADPPFSSRAEGEATSNGSGQAVAGTSANR
jgi:hypothetical protein